jgi:hypothetical protein
MASELTAPDDLESEVMFGRSRALKLLGGAFFGLVTHRLVRSAPALAQHNTPPGPCFDYPRCHYCNGSTCYQYCHWHSAYGYDIGCPSSFQCWLGCANGLVYQCCDWHEVFPGHSQHGCLCRSSALAYC